MSTYTHLLGIVIITVIIMIRLLVRFNDALATYPRLDPLINNLYQRSQEWHAGVEVTPLFDNPFNNTLPVVREHVIDSIRDFLVSIVPRDGPRQQQQILPIA